jgi:ketosteroid isomerase-like protein
MKSERSRFLDEAYRRANAGDPRVFEECFSRDFVYVGPEARLLSPDGSLRGKEAVKQMAEFERNDRSSWERVTREVVTEIETEEETFRVMKWTARGPRKPYLGIDPEDLPAEVSVYVFQLFTFKEGKIYREFFAYDTLGFLMDITQGDLEKAIKALQTVMVLPHRGMAARSTQGSATKRHSAATER